MRKFRMNLLAACGVLAGGTLLGLLARFAQWDCCFEVAGLVLVVLLLVLLVVVLCEEAEGP